MRLGQLSRKLDITPAEIVQFLATKNVTIDVDVNSKLEEEAVRVAMDHFAPDLSEQIAANEREPEQVPEGEIEESASREQNIQDEGAKEAQPVDVIKAPKIELAGLKVVGKIELPEKKKKEEPESKPIEKRKPEKTKRSDRGSKRPRPNPVALQRQKEAAEAARKREEERRIQKERRTQNYLNKVKAVQPTKAAKIIKEKTEVLSPEELVDPPKGWFRKFLKWLTT